jgi:hypothetical protein
LTNQPVHVQDRRGPMHGIFGLLSSRGGRSLAGSFGERCGDAAMDDVGSTKSSSSIRNDRDPKPVPEIESTASMPTFLDVNHRAVRRRSRREAITPKLGNGRHQFRRFRELIVCKTSDIEFIRLRIARAYIRLLCLSEYATKMVSLTLIGNYEVRMLGASKADTDDGSLFLIELFDHDAQSSVDSNICCSIDEGVAAFQDFISR